MTSPGGVEVGRVSVRVVPDTSKFLAKAKKDLEEIARKLRVDVEVALNTESAKAEVDKLKAEAGREKVKMGAEVDGDGVVRETRRVKNLAQKLVGAIRMTVGINTAASLTRIKAELKVIKNAVEGYNIRIPVEFVGLSKWLGIIGLISGALLTIPHLIGAIGGAVNVVGGLLATLPALAAAASFGIAALVVGMQGFFSALSQSGDTAKFEEALKNLTPAAQESARALAEFREPLTEIRKSVQESLFSGMADPLRELKSLLPPIESGLVGSAAGIREMAKAWIQMATSQRSIEDTQTIADNVSSMFDRMRPAAANFGQAMRDITVVASTFLPRLGSAVSEITGKFAAWAEKARETGRLDQIIENAIDKVKQLGRIIADVTVGFRNIFQSMTGGQDFLDILERITQNFREWSAAKDTQETLARLAKVMRAVADAAWELFQQVFKSAGAILKDLEPFLLTLARGIGAVLGGAIRAVTPLLQSFARWLSENRLVVVPLVIALVSLVTAFKLAVTAANGILALKKSIDSLRAASSIIGEMTTGVLSNLKKIVVGIAKTTAAWATAAAQWAFSWATIAADAAKKAAITAAEWIKSAVKSAAFTARYYAIMAAQAIKAWVKMVAAATANAVKIAATWIVQLTRMVAATIAQMAVAVAAWVANWVRMAAAATANAIRMAAAWVIAMGPIGWIIAAIIALVALVIANWDSIKNATVNAWNAIWKFVSDIITAIVNFLGNIWDAVQDVIQWFIDMGNGIIDGIQAGLDWLGDIKDKILGFFKDAGKWLWETGKNLVKGLWDGWKAYFDDFEQAVVDDGNRLIDNINGIFEIFSPSRVFRRIGEYLGKGLEIGVHDSMTSAIQTAGSLARTLSSTFDQNANIDPNWANGITEGIPDAVAAVDKLVKATNDRADLTWSGVITADDMEPLEDRVLAALATGLKVELDGKNVTKSVNANNLANQRRK